MNWVTAGSVIKPGERGSGPRDAYRAQRVLGVERQFQLGELPRANWEYDIFDDYPFTYGYPVPETNRD
ncbi:hypothetical protein AB0L82_26805 [Nocardia sp. NPDC052001]|uniref:hypothetical protein n=1 Tax=Nocardia sp. NPDC052001 TaxID=3154853 RepID=UPI00343257FA